MLRLNWIFRNALSRRWLCVALMFLSLQQLSVSGWIYLKSELAQKLLDSAWQQTLVTQLPVKAWPWADTWPIARLQMADKNIDWLVMAGAHGEALAFGPGHISASAKPGYGGSTIIAGHRDTHFSFLQTLALGELLQLVNDRGERQSFAITAIDIVDSAKARLKANNERPQLLLVTCYPFDAVSSGGSLRYVVSAELVADSEIDFATGSITKDTETSLLPSSLVSMTASHAVRYQL